MRFLLAVLVVVGCGSSDKVSSISESKALSSLTKDETKQYCKDMSAYRKKKMATADSIKLACSGSALAGVLSGDFKDDEAVRAACKKSYDDCVASPPKDADKDLDCDKEDVFAEVSKCADLTIGDMNACATEMQDRLNKISAVDHCKTLELKDRSKAITGFMDSLKGPKCDLVETKCNKGKPSGSNDGVTIDDGTDDKDMIAMVGKLEEFTNQACGCADKACTDAVNATMGKWTQEMANSPLASKKPSLALGKRAAETMSHFTQCVSKFDKPPAPGSAK